MNEFDHETNEGFGLCAMEYPEWGYFSLDELAKEDAQEIVVNPPQTYEQLLETELRANLSSEELERVFYGKLIFEEDLWKNLPDEPDEQTTSHTQIIGGIEVTTVKVGANAFPPEEGAQEEVNNKPKKQL